MHRRTAVCLTILALFLFSSLSLVSPFTGTPTPLGAEDNNDYSGSGFSPAPMMPPPPEGPSWDGSEYYYGGLGQVLTAKEFSHGENASLHITDLDYGETEWGQIEIPSGWTGYQLDGYVYNLFDNITHITGSTRNGDFESGTSSPTYWSQSQRGMSGSGLNALGWNYGTAYGETSKGINVQANCSSYDWVSNATYVEYVGWTQTIDLNRLGVTSATLSFDVQFYDLGMGYNDEDEMAIYAEVGGATRTLVCHQYCPNAQNFGWGFHSIEFSLTPDELLAWSSDTINVTLGLTVDFDWNIGDYYAMDFDNVVLRIQGKPSPDNSRIQLNLNSTSSWTGTDYGSGTTSLTGTWGPYGTANQIAVNWTTGSSGSRNVDFDYTLTLYMRRTKTTESQTGPEGTAFWVRHGTSAYWTAWFFAPFYPTYYANYEFAIEKPTTETWTLDTAIDPNLDDQTTAVNAASNSTHIVLTPSEVTAFGWWNFTFSSTNQITSVTGVQPTYYINPRTPYQFSFTAHFDTVTTGQVNYTIYDSDRTTIDEGTASLAGSTHGWTIYFNSGDTFTAGTHTLCVSYDNGAPTTQTAAGFYSTEFDIEHDTSLTPETNPLSVDYSAGSFFYPRVFYADTDRSDIFVGNTSGTVRVNATISGVSGVIDFYQAGSWYEAKVSDSIFPSAQDYTMTINATADYHDFAQTTITLQVRSDATLSSPDSPGLTVACDETFEISLFYEDAANQGIVNALIKTNWPSAPVSTLNGSGWYNITYDTSDLGTPQTFTLNIEAQRNYYTTRTLVLTIVVRELSTTIEYTPPGSVAWDEDVVINFDFVVDDPDSQYDGNGLASATITSVTLDASPISAGSDYTFSDLGGGSYRFTILASSGKINTVKSYTLVLNLAPADSKYSNSTRTITFSVRALETGVIYTPPLPTPYGEDVVITFSYLVDDPESSHDGEGITGLTSIAGTTLDGSALLGGQYTLVDNGGGSYTLTILYSSGRISSIKSYSLLLVVNSPSTLYQDSSREISFSVRALVMQVTFDPIPTTPWGDNIIITFYYRISDAASSQNGNGLAGVTSIAGSTLDAVALVPSDYTLVDNGGGQYTLTLLYSSGKLSSIKTYTLYLYVNSPDSQHDDASASNNFTVRTLSTQVTYVPVIPVPWSEDVAITFYYTVNDPASSQHGNGITGVTDIVGSTLDAVGLVLSDYTLVEVGSGEYTLTILYSSGKINSIKSYALYLYVNSPDTQHDDATQSISFNVRQLRTYITYDAVATQPRGENIVITFYYTVNDPASSLDGSGITGVTSIAGSTLDAVALVLSDYTLVDNGGGQYTLTILYSSGKISSVKTYNLYLYVNSPDAQHEDANQNIAFTVRALLTSISFDPIPQAPYGNDIEITFYYVVNDVDSSQHGNGITGVTDISGSTLDAVALALSDYTLVEVGGGEYTLTILYSSGKISTIKTYTLALHVVAPSAIYNSADRTTNFIVRQLGTKISYDPPLPTPYGNDLVITIYYLVEDTASAQHGNGITGVTDISGSTLDAVALALSDYTLVEVGGGEYTLTILFSSGKISSIKTYLLELVMVAPSVEYANGNQQVNFEVRSLTTQVVFDQPSPTPWGDDVVIVFYYRVSDLASSQHGNGITGVSDLSGSTLDAVALVPSDYTLVDNGGGQYTLTLLYSSGKLNSIKTYTLSLYVNAPLSRYDDATRDLDFDVRIIDTLVSYVPTPPVPRGTNVVIVFYYTVNDPSSSQHQDGITGVTSIAGSTLDAVALNPADYTLVDNGGGQYTLTILFSSGKISSIKNYSLYLYVNSPDSQHEDAAQNVGFEIRTIRTAITYDAVGSVAWGTDVVITFYYIVDDSASGEDGNGIAGVTSIAGSTLDGSALNPADYNLVDDGGGQYTLTIYYSSGKISTVKVYSLALHVVAPDTYHEDADQTIGFRIRNHNVASDIDPISSIPWQNDGTMILRVTDDDVGSPLPDIDMIAIEIIGPTTLYIDSGNWNTWVTNGTADDGEFVVRFDTTGWSLSTHSLTINVFTTSNYENDTVYSAATVRALAISFTYQSPPVVPWGEDGELNVTYLVSDPVASQDGNPITGGTISIAGLTVGVEFSFTDNLDGTYTITVFASYLSSVTTYPLDITMTSPDQYTNGLLNDVPLSVRKLFTTLTYSQVPTTPYGDNIIADVEYMILDGESSNNGAFISGATITVTGIGGLTIQPSDYFVTEFATYYRITITKSLAIGSYEIEVDATHSSGNYRDADIANPAMTINVRTVYTETEKAPVDAAPYGENFTITITYSVRDDASSQDGNGIPGATDITVTTNGSWVLSSYDLIDNGNGIYTIIINSDETPTPGRYWIRVDIGWLASPPIYEEQWVGVWLTSADRETHIINTNPPDTNFADFIIVYVNYTDVYTNWGIDNTTTGDYVRIRILHASNDSEITSDYFIEIYPGSGSWDEPTLYYRVLINASQLGAVNVIFNFKIEASWFGGNAPFYETATKAFSVRTTGTSTILYSETVQTQPTGDDITIKVHYNTTGGLPITNSTGYVGIIVKCEDIPTWDDTYWYVTPGSQPGTNGIYIIIIEGSKNLDFGTYTFNITLTWPPGLDPQYSPYYASARTLASGRIREIQTSMSWTQSSQVFYSQNLTILANYTDLDHGDIHISDAIWTLSIGLPFSYDQHANGSWIIEIDTSGLSAGVFSFDLIADKANYLTQTRDIDIQIKDAPLTLTAISHPSFSITEIWGVNITVTVYLNFQLNGSPVITGEVFYKWFEYDYLPMPYSGTPGYYTVILDTVPVNATGTQLYIETRLPNYETELQIYSVSIQQVNTRLELPLGDITAISMFVDDIVQLNVTFEGWNGTHWYPISGADVKANNVSTWLADFNSSGPGFYTIQFNTSTWRIRTHTIIVIASSPNSVERQVTFTITVQYKPCEILVEYESYSAFYKQTVTFNIFLNDTRGERTYNPIGDHPLYFIWQTTVYPLVGNGTDGWYTGSFVADVLPSSLAREIGIYHDVFGKYSDSSTTVPLTVEKAQTRLIIVSAYTLATIDGEEYNITVHFNSPNWFIPIGDTLVLTFRYTDRNNITLPRAEVLDPYFRFVDTEFFDFDNNTNLWTVHFTFNNPTDYEATISFPSDYYDSKTVTKNLVVDSIPMEIIEPADLPNRLYIGMTYTFALYLNDTYHNAGVTNASVTASGFLAPPIISINEDPLHPGYYNVTIRATTQGSGTTTFSALKANYELDQDTPYLVTVELDPLMSNIITYGAIGAVILVIALIGWIMWARVYSIPWEVRRMRSLAKKIEKEEGYTLSKKDLKRFHDKEITLKDKVTVAMATVGVAATPAMMPTIEEVEEVTATEEDIMGELDKIPGLGPEEKAVLAEEMRKIPRKDRIWFLDDLRRQMGQRRMDFLTTREKPKTPAPEPGAEPTPPEVAPTEPEAPPLEEVKPKEPPPSKVLTEDRTAPTVLPPDLQAAPAAPAVVIAEIRRELSKIPGLSNEEKDALVDHLQYLSKEERQATYRSLKMSANQDE